MATNPPNLEDFDDLTNQARQEQRLRQQIIAPAVGAVARQHGTQELRRRTERQARETYRGQVEAVIRDEARTVAQRLRQSGVKPDVKLDERELQQPNRTRRMRDIRTAGDVRATFRGKAKLKKRGEIGAWILTPPTEVTHHRSSDAANWDSYPGGRRAGFALGEDGQIYMFRIDGKHVHRETQGVPDPRSAQARGKDPKHLVKPFERLSLITLGPEAELVPISSITEGPNGLEYTDQITDTYGHPDGLGGYIPRPGEDDTSIIHGLGIREALAALNARAQRAQQHPRPAFP